MTENEKVTRSKTSADRLLRGVLTKLGDTFDRFTGRRWIPSSSLAASELVERMKKLLDSEAKTVPGKGVVVPHNIKLKMQWDKFSTDSESSLKILETELLTAAVDHINDRLYYTFAPLSLEVKPDYFTEGVKLLVSFDKFADEDREAELNLTVPVANVGGVLKELDKAASPVTESFFARFTVNGVLKEVSVSTRVNGRISVGRTVENALVIDDPSVSKIHASLVVSEDGRLAVADTGSTNGTFVNGERISYGKAVSLSDADKVKFGTVEVTFEHVPRPPSSDESLETDVGQEKTIEIGGFEFTSRVTPADVAETQPQVPLPAEDTLRIEPESDENDRTEDQTGNTTH